MIPSELHAASLKVVAIVDSNEDFKLPAVVIKIKQSPMDLFILLKLIGSIVDVTYVTAVHFSIYHHLEMQNISKLRSWVIIMCGFTLLKKWSEIWGYHFIRVNYIYSHIIWLNVSNYMVTSSNGNIFRVTGPLCEEFTFTGHKGQWRGALMFSLICAWINAWENNR